MIEKLPNFIVFAYVENCHFTTMGTPLFQLAQQIMKSCWLHQTFLQFH